MYRVMSYGALAVAVAIWTTGPALAGANLLTNGDFETPGTHGAIPPGWTNSTAVAGGPGNALNIGLYQGADYGPCCGAFGTSAALANHFAGFGVGNSPNAGGSLAQRFATAAGETYEASFEIGALGYPYLSQDFTVSLNDVGTDDLLASQTYTAYVDDDLNTTFTTYGFDFTATGASTRISFVDTSQTISVDGIVDNVSVSGVPETSTWAMMLVGFACIGLLRHRTTRKSAALAA